MKSMKHSIHAASLRHTAPRLLVIIGGLLVSIPVSAQSFDLSWHTIDGGGATFSTGGTLQLGGTIGQPDASSFGAPMSGGTFTVVGGFWPAAADVCTLPGDMNHDGFIDGDDVQLFTDCVLAGTGSCGCADRAGGGVSAS